MALLLPPSPETMVFRRAKSDLSPAGQWHLPKNGRERVTACGDFITHFHAVDLAKLEDIKADELCPACWLFGKVDTSAVTIQDLATAGQIGAR
jgi:hypothetical protein